jgi:hypothetical protein
MNTPGSESPADSVQATRTMFEIVEYLRDAEQLTVTEIADRTG